MRRSLLIGFTPTGEVAILAGPNPQAAKDAGKELFSARSSEYAEIQLWTSGRGVTRRRRFSQSPAAETAVVENPGGSSTAAGAAETQPTQPETAPAASGSTQSEPVPSDSAPAPKKKNGAPDVKF